MKLMQHIKYVHKGESKANMRQMCDLCGKEYANLKAHHLKEHTDTKQIWECPDPLCFKFFKTEAAMIGHGRTCHDSASFGYPCPDCGRKFSSKAKVLQHKCEDPADEPVAEEGDEEKKAHFKLFHDGGKYDVMEQLKEDLRGDQASFLDNFVFKTEYFEQDRENYKRLISVMYYVGKRLAQRKPPALNAKDSTMFFQTNVKRFMHSAAKLKPILYKKFVHPDSKNSGLVLGRLLKAAKTGFDKKETSQVERIRTALS